jgi:hypothetical protein
MKAPITVIKNNISLTPYKFYTDFLVDIASSYSDDPEQVSFKLFENGDEFIYNSYYRIDPITIPLLLSLLEQLSKYHKNKIELFLYNNLATIEVLKFLHRSDFFYICGENRNPTFPLGRNIALYEDGYLGLFEGKIQRSEHKVRTYSLDDDNLLEELKLYQTDEQRRDFLISHYTYKVREHFEELLFDNEHTDSFHNTYIDILAELITNGVIHSKSNTFALMFVDRFKTKFSISDNGIGLDTSIKAKLSTFYYQPQSLTKILSERSGIMNISEKILNNLYAIFETLYYSSLRDRKGLFDLMINVVLNSKGYFRIHTENCQVIISNRMMDELIELGYYRNEIYNLHSKFSLKLIDEKSYQESVLNLSGLIRSRFVLLFKKSEEKYNSDIKYSALRFFKVRFRGVHIEVEIPNE